MSEDEGCGADVEMFEPPTGWSVNNDRAFLLDDISLAELENTHLRPHSHIFAGIYCSWAKSVAIVIGFKTGATHHGRHGAANE